MGAGASGNRIAGASQLGGCTGGEQGRTLRYPHNENALSGQDLTVNGNGTDALDFTYIDDLIQGILLTITQPAAINQVFNLTYGDARQLKQMAELVMEHFPGIHLRHNPRDQLVPERGTLCIDKAWDLLGYAPKFPLETGFVKYIEWYKDFAARNPDLFHAQ